MPEPTIPDNRKESLPHEYADVSAHRSPAEHVLEEIRTTRVAWTLCEAGKLPIDFATDVKNLWNLFDKTIGAPPDIGDLKDQQQARMALRLMEAALTPTPREPPPAGSTATPPAEDAAESEQLAMAEAPTAFQLGSEGETPRGGSGSGNETHPVLTFAPGMFTYRRHEEKLSGKPRQVLEALWQAQGKTLTLKALRDKIWTDSVVGEDTIRSAVSNARKALRRAIEAVHGQCEHDPIDAVERGSGLTAWRLKLP